MAEKQPLNQSPQLDLQPYPGPAIVIKRAASLFGGSTLIDEECVHVDPNKKVHIWALSNRTVLVLLEQNKTFVGVTKKKGSFKAIVDYYRRMVVPENTTKNLH
jgi:hypothetical protein